MEHTFQINQQAEVVFDYLTDMQKYQSLHPTNTKIDDLGNNKYVLHKRMKFGPIPYTFSYPITITGDRNSFNIKMVAVVQWFNTLEIGFRMIPTVNYTIVEETITFKSLLPLQFLMENSFRKQHKILFKNVNDLPED
jgi:ribosome-associated toxin RatA of RatAB toxin-antitoxin module